MKTNQSHVGVLLAGGMSRRYGSPKAFARHNEKYFYEIAYEILSRVCQHVIIVTRQELIERFPSNLHIIVDDSRFVGDGPLAGIYSAMEKKSADQYVVLPCDMPLMTLNVMEHIVNYHKQPITVAVHNGKLQPLVSVWSKDVKEKIFTALQNKQLKMKDFLKGIPVGNIVVDHLNHGNGTFMNVNTPENERELRKWRQS